MNIIKTTIALLCVAVGISASAADSGRSIKDFDAGWKFNLGDTPAASNPSFNDRAWRTLNLPHDWSIEGENLENAPGGGQVGYFPSGTGWYRKTFDVKGFSKSKLYSIEFDGVYMNSEVWINGHHLGKWPYGYSSFSYDLTPYLKARGNVIAVKVDNSNQPNSRWYTGSGIYRHVRLVETAKLHFAQWGIYANTESLEGNKASVRVKSEVVNPASASFSIRHELIDTDGNVVATTDSELLAVNSVRPWSLEDPYMYTLRSSIISAGKVIDAVDTPFGVRTMRYEPHEGFFLNGKHVKMKGVNVHHDGGAVGAAVPERVWERRIEILKSGGCNAIRTAHNIPSPEFLDLCDKHGMLVMDEAFDQWVEGKNDFDYHIEFNEWYERDLSCMVKRDRNHPSVAMWSIGNEIPDQSTQIGPSIARKMIALCHQLDPSRLVTAGNDRIVADDHPATAEFLAAFANDIVGYNYPDRWRRRRESNYTEDKIRFPERRVIATESGGMGGSRGPAGARRGFSAPGTPALPSSTSFIDTEQRWKYALVNDFVIGDFMWTGIDYYGETRWPSRGAQSGYLDNCGFKKDGYYFFKSIWSEEPVLHLVGGWNYPEEKKGQIMQVTVFTNCSYVELFVNGRSYGTKSMEFPRKGSEGTWNGRAAGKVSTTTADLHLAWDVEYQEGEVKLVGIKDGKTFEEVIRTAGTATQMKVSLDRDAIKVGNRDAAHVTVELYDANGTLATGASNLVTFNTNAKLIGVESGNMADLSSTKANSRKAFAGMCLGIVQADKAGNYNITVNVEGIGSKTISFKAE